MKKILLTTVAIAAIAGISSASSFDYKERLKKHQDLLAAGKHSYHDVAGDGVETCIPGVCYVGEYSLESGTLKPVILNARKLLLAAKQQAKSVEVASTHDVFLESPWLQELAKQNSLSYEEMIAILDEVAISMPEFKEEAIKMAAEQHRKEVIANKKQDKKVEEPVQPVIVEPMDPVVVEPPVMEPPVEDPPVVEEPEAPVAPPPPPPPPPPPAVDEVEPILILDEFTYKFFQDAYTTGRVKHLRDDKIIPGTDGKEYVKIDSGTPGYLGSDGKLWKELP